MVKYYIHFCLSLVLLGCDSTSNKIEDNEEDPCQLIDFQKEFKNDLNIKSVFGKCEPEWKYNLRLFKGSDLIFSQDTIIDYQFNNYPFPTYVKDSLYEYILIERDDRPFLNKIDIFIIQSKKVLSVYSIPFFENPPKDVDGDGIAEYWGWMEAREAVYIDSVDYNPALVYEIDENSIRFDTAGTIAFNTYVYGRFYGFEANENLFFPREKINNNLP